MSEPKKRERALRLTKEVVAYTAQVHADWLSNVYYGEGFDEALEKVFESVDIYFSSARDEGLYKIILAALEEQE